MHNNIIIIINKKIYKTVHDTLFIIKQYTCLYNMAIFFGL